MKIYSVIRITGFYRCREYMGVFDTLEKAEAAVKRDMKAHYDHEEYTEELCVKRGSHEDKTVYYEVWTDDCLDASWDYVIYIGELNNEIDLD